MSYKNKTGDNIIIPSSNSISSEFERIIDSIAWGCRTKLNENGSKMCSCWLEIDFREIKDGNEDSNDDPPIHAKSLDMVAKHAKVYPKKGTLPSGHRGDLVKVRNGHGGYVPFNKNER